MIRLRADAATVFQNYLLNNSQAQAGAAARRKIRLKQTLEIGRHYTVACV
jgi:hypothetical protein